MTLWSAIALAIIALGLGTSRAFAEEERLLQLEVLIWGKPIGLIGAFRQSSNGSLSAERKELEELGLKVPDRYRPDDEIPLSDLPGVRYRYDEAMQIVDVAVDDEARLPKVYDARPIDKPMLNNQSSTGVVLNYLLFGGAGSNSLSTNWQLQGVSATLDARFFSPIGIFSQSGIVASDSGNGVISQRLRLDSTWVYADPGSARVYRVGDTISGGLVWTRPIRLGGFQAQSDFAVRPDLVTLPLPNFSGSAAVPSTVDVYVNNVRTISQNVDSGPFRITNVPILSGQGDASIVVRDSSGREVQTTLPFFVSSKLLRAGLFDFSAEAGYPRLYYGVLSDVYGNKPVGSATARYGLSDRITLEAHSEGTSGLVNGGVGAVVGVDSLGLFSVALAGSRGYWGSGGQLYAGFDTTLFGLTLSASTQRTIRRYDDLASATSVQIANGQSAAYQAAVLASGFYQQSPFQVLRPPRIEDQLSIGFPLPFRAGSVNFGFVREEDQVGNHARILDVTYSRQLFNNASLYASAYADLDNHKNVGLSFGLSIPLGSDVTGSTGASRTGYGVSVVTEVSKPLTQEPGSVGWDLRDMEGQQAQRSASAAYRSDYGTVQATAAQQRGGLTGTIQNEGAVVLAGGDIFFANRINDAFAVVDAGAPGLQVFSENRPVAHTDGNGKALVPSLNSYQSNKVSIDPRDLPLNASIQTTQEILSPTYRGGIIVDFGIKTDVRSAIVIFDGPNGLPLQTGLHGRTASGHDFVIGYDGRAYIEGLDAKNIAIVHLPEGQCQVEFAYAPQYNTQVLIGPTVCR